MDMGKDKDIMPVESAQPEPDANFASNEPSEPPPAPAKRPPQRRPRAPRPAPMPLNLPPPAPRWLAVIESREMVDSAASQPVNADCKTPLYYRARTVALPDNFAAGMNPDARSPLAYRDAAVLPPPSQRTFVAAKQGCTGLATHLGDGCSSSGGLKTPETGQLRSATKFSQTLLWEFILELLLDQRFNSIVRWTGNPKSVFEFEFTDVQKVAKLWGRRKNRPRMNPDKLHRALRYYRDRNFIDRVGENNNKYVFGPFVRKYVDESSIPLQHVDNDDDDDDLQEENQSDSEPAFVVTAATQQQLPALLDPDWFMPAAPAAHPVPVEQCEFLGMSVEAGGSSGRSHGQTRGDMSNKDQRVLCEKNALESWTGSVPGNEGDNDVMPILYNLPQCNHAGEAACTGATEALLCPLERIQTLLQSARYNKQFKNTVGAAAHVHLYGIREFYRGVSAVLVRNSLSNVLFFGFRDPIRRLMAGDDATPAVRYAGAFVSGAVLGAIISTLFYPANVVKTRMQSTLGGRHLSAWHVAKVLLKERGSFAAMFRGVQLNFTRSLTTWGITNLLYDLLKRWSQGVDGVL